MWVWFSGAAIALNLVLVGGLFTLILVNGLGSFWPRQIVRLELADGRLIQGQIVGSEVAAPLEQGGQPIERVQVKQGNRDIYGEDFVWVDENNIRARSLPPDVFLIERREWGNFIGSIEGIYDGEQRLEVPPTPAALAPLIEQSDALRAEALAITRDEMGEVNRRAESLRLERARVTARGSSADAGALESVKKREAELESRYRLLEAKLEQTRARSTKRVKLVAVGGQEKWLPVSDIVRAYQPNRLSFFEALKIYMSKLAEFVWEDPRESNTEGGVFPAIFGTVMVVILMSIVVTPLGVIAAIYLREYAKQGRFVSFVRIAVNNLAGVPSIVFGVFGVGFFVYGVGGTIDRLFFAESLPTPTFGTGGILWASLTLALLTVPTVIVATEEGLASIPKHLREGSYALGATKLETTLRVVLPSLTPSILTGMILAVARAAGEVAPLMITGVVKLAPSLPVDSVWPYFHFDRKFMHLGFHIYDVGFQSPNVEAARPMVYMTAALLILIVVCLNLTALVLRNRLRKRLATSAV